MPNGPMTAVEANRRMYAEIAEDYDSCEDCVVDPELRGRLVETLAEAVGILKGRGSDISALDACGGSGNASLILLEHGITPETVDLSPEMIGIYERKARAAGHEPETAVAEIGTFLREAGRSWDLVVFASALHHLDDYLTVVDFALDRVSPGGILVAWHEPLHGGRVGQVVRRLDYMAYVIRTSPGRLPGLFVQRVRGLVSRVRGGRGDSGKEAAEPNVGALAEKYAQSGVDADAIVRLVEARGGKIVAHPRYHNARFAITRRLLRRLDAPTTFSLTAQLPPA